MSKPSEKYLDELSGFVNLRYPKGDKERGIATVAITLFLIYLDDNAKD